MKKKKINQELFMYFLPDIANKFADSEQNEKNFRVAKIVDRVIIKEVKHFKDPIFVAELGGGAHPDRYHKFFKKLLKKPQSHIDWVDISPYMLELAKKYLKNKKYQNREKIINFLQSDIIKYLQSIDDVKIDLGIMKYTFGYIKDIKILFKLLSKKLKHGGKLVSTIGNLGPELKSCSTNARFLYHGKQFPDDEVRILKDGDNFRVKFFKISGKPDFGYLKGAEVTKYYHSPKKIKKLAKMFNFHIFLGNWKKYIVKKDQGGENMDQNILLLTKK